MKNFSNGSVTKEKTPIKQRISTDYLSILVPVTIEKLNLYKAIVEFSKALDFMPRLRNKLENGRLFTPI